MRTVILIITCMVFAYTVNAAGVKFVPDPNSANDCSFRFIVDQTGEHYTQDQQMYKRNAQGNYDPCNKSITGPNTFDLGNFSVEAAPALMMRLSDAEAASLVQVGGDIRIPHGNTPFYYTGAFMIDPDNPDNPPVIRYTSGLLVDFNSQPVKVMSFTPVSGGYDPVFDPSESLPPQLMRGDGWFRRDGGGWEKTK